MRDNHEGLLEIINAYERDEHYFCSVALTIGTEMRIFEFGTDRNGYKAIKRILNLRPFELYPGVSYRYFFSPKIRLSSSDITNTYCNVRIEQGEIGKEFEVEAPKSLVANLMWFIEVKDFKEVTHLKEIT